MHKKQNLNTIWTEKIQACFDTKLQSTNYIVFINKNDINCSVTIQALDLVTKDRRRGENKTPAKMISEWDLAV